MKRRVLTTWAVRVCVHLLVVIAIILGVDGLAGSGIQSALADPGSSPAPPPGPVIVNRDGVPHTVTVDSSTGGEGLLAVTAEAPGINWEVAGAESALLVVMVDGRHAADVLVVSDHPVTTRHQLGHLRSGAHTLTFALAGEASAPAARTVVVREVAVSVVPPEGAGWAALVHSPVLHGRSLPGLGGRFQNTRTDMPLLAWHTGAAVPGRPGHSLLEYSIMWSNEDGGNGGDPAYQQAIWGRQTDIEWVYRVEVDPAGSAVPGTAFHQGPNHLPRLFSGRYENGHPVLQTCTANNMVCDVVVDPGLRFAPAADSELSGGMAREQLMDLHPWTYQVATAEARREGKIEAVASPDTPALSDPCNYLYVLIRKSTSSTATGSPGRGDGVGLTVGVRLHGEPGILYRSDHSIAGWSLRRDGLLATAVELPPGAVLDDVAAIEVLRVPATLSVDPGISTDLGISPAGIFDPGPTVTVTGIERAIMLGADAMPAPGSLAWAGSVTLTAAEPTKTVFRSS